MLNLALMMIPHFLMIRDQILGSANEREEVQLRIQRAHTRDLGSYIEQVFKQSFIITKKF